MPTEMKCLHGHSDGVKNAGEFTYLWDAGKADPVGLCFSNPSCNMGHGRCAIHIKKGEAVAPFFGWDGNFEKPTIVPSIGCDHLCGWHGHITNGVILP